MDGKGRIAIRKKTSPPQAIVESVQLSSKDLSLVPIAAYTAIGNLTKLKLALIQGLETGLTVNQIKEVFAHQYAYVGFPRALNGMLTFKSLLEEREKQGIKDRQGAMPSPLQSDTDYYQLNSCSE